MEDKVFRDLFLGPEVLVEVVLKDEVLVVGVSEKVDLGIGLEFVVEVFVGVSVRKLDHRVFEVTNRFKHGVDH